MLYSFKLGSDALMVTGAPVLESLQIKDELASVPQFFFFGLLPSELEFIPYNTEENI